MKNYKKKLMLLGGLRYLLPVIEAAHNLGIYVITVDYLPDNIAHKYSDEYHNVSITEKDAVLRLARDLHIDGIMSFAVDPGVVTAAYVAEKMGLPFQGSYESVCILQNKSLFRKFLTENGFNVPHAKGYNDINAFKKDIDFFKWPVIVKPVDSAGSKGVSKIENPSQIDNAVSQAIEESHCGQFIVEDFIEKAGNSSDSDCFSVNGKLTFCSFSDQLFDVYAKNPYTPSAYVWPSTMPKNAQEELKSELQRLIELLHIRSGIYNVETRICTDGKPYIMEFSPRGGGNRLAEMLRYSTRTPLIELAVKTAVGMDIAEPEMPYYYGHIAEIILHAHKDGIFEKIDISPEMQKHVVELDLWIKSGESVKGFSGANNAIGTLVLRFNTPKDIETAMNDINSWCKVVQK